MKWIYVEKNKGKIEQEFIFPNYKTASAFLKSEKALAKSHSFEIKPMLETWEQRYRNLKIKDRNGFEIEISTVLHSQDCTKETLGGFARGDGEFIPFHEWKSVFHKADIWDTESYWYPASEFEGEPRDEE